MGRHITDSNSCPLDLSAFPELAAAAAYSQTERFDEKTVQDLIKYAGEVSHIGPLRP
jgi:hexosaminidase